MHGLALETLLGHIHLPDELLAEPPAWPGAPRAVAAGPGLRGHAPAAPWAVDGLLGDFGHILQSVWRGRLHSLSGAYQIDSCGLSIKR